MYDSSVFQTLVTLLGPDGVVAGDAIDPKYLHDWNVPMAGGAPRALVRPRSTTEVAAVMRACHAAGVAVVPQGGLTGIVGGATPVTGCVVLALERLTGIEEIDDAAATMTVCAGTPLQTIQDAAREAGMFVALDLGARGSCQIGGNVATNAGGNRVIRFGMTRDLVLGLEVVLADGTIVTSLNKLIKNNTGADIRQFFIGSEGTLGVITRVVLRLLPDSRGAVRRVLRARGLRPRRRAAAACAGGTRCVALGVRGVCGRISTRSSPAGRRRAGAAAGRGRDVRADRDAGQRPGVRSDAIRGRPRRGPRG